MATAMPVRSLPAMQLIRLAPRPFGQLGKIDARIIAIEFGPEGDLAIVAAHAIARRCRRRAGVLTCAAATCGARCHRARRIVAGSGPPRRTPPVGGRDGCSAPARSADRTRDEIQRCDPLEIGVGSPVVLARSPQQAAPQPPAAGHRIAAVIAKIVHALERKDAVVAIMVIFLLPILAMLSICGPGLMKQEICMNAEIARSSARMKRRSA